MKNHLSIKLQTTKRLFSYLRTWKRGYLEYNGIYLIFLPSLITWELYKHLYQGTYESSEYDLIQKHLDADTSVIELGAGVGFISCLTAKILQKNTKHLALEPTPKLKNIIEKNMKLNDAVATILPYAYHPTRSQVHMYIHHNFWSNSLQKASGRKRSVEAKSLANLKKEYNLATFVLVADIEGGEIDLIQKELPLLEQSCEKIIIEFHPLISGVDQALKKLEASCFSEKDGRGKVRVFYNCCLHNNLER